MDVIKKIIEKFRKEEEGAVIQWILVLAVVAVIGYMVFPKTKEVANEKHEESVENVRIGLEGSKSISSSDGSVFNQSYVDIHADPEYSKLEYPYGQTITFSTKTFGIKGTQTTTWKSDYPGKTSEYKQNTFTIEFYEAGTYTISVQVCNEDKKCVTDTKKVFIKHPPIVTYYDATRKPIWISNAQTFANAFDKAGYPIQDAKELKKWMEDQIKDNDNKGKTMVIMVQDACPDTICDSGITKNSLIRQYLDAGGSVVWAGDVPFYYLSKENAPLVTVHAENGDFSILGIDSFRSVTETSVASISPAGNMMKLSDKSWKSRRPQEVKNGIIPLAINANGWANSWFKNFNSSYPQSGFYRYRDAAVDGSNVIVQNEVLKIVNSFKNGQIPMEKNYRSCLDILKDNKDAENGDYMVVAPNGSYQKIECNMEDDGGGWMKVADYDYLKDTTPPQNSTLQAKNAFYSTSHTDQAPAGWYPQFTTNSNGMIHAATITSNESKLPYKEVKMEMKAKLLWSIDSFGNTHGNPPNRYSIDGQYLDGISVTSGEEGSRTHLWSVTWTATLPSDARKTFIGNNLISGQNIEGSYTRILSNTLNEKIETRIMLDQTYNDENIGLQKLFIWIR